jgi:dCMP deaminase
MNRPSWDETWMTVAETVAKRARCSRAQIGAVIIDTNNRVCATGYNGPAATYPEKGECINWCPRAKGESPLDNLYDACPSIHAEGNALLYSESSAIKGGTIYVTAPPCMQCAKLISNSGLRRVVANMSERDFHRRPEEVIAFLNSCGITVDIVNKTDLF